MSLEEVIDKIVEELKTSNQSRAYDEISELYHCYTHGSLAEKMNCLEALNDWCHPKALGDLKVLNSTNDEWLNLLASLKSKCKKKSRQLQKLT